VTERMVYKVYSTEGRVPDIELKAVSSFWNRYAVLEISWPQLLGICREDLVKLLVFSFLDFRNSRL
jgi:hypothetical protein